MAKKRSRGKKSAPIGTSAAYQRVKKLVAGQYGVATNVGSGKSYGRFKKKTFKTYGLGPR